MANKVKLVLVDFGGVLVRTRSRAKREFWEESLGLKYGELDQIVFGSPIASLATIGKATQTDVYNYVSSFLNLSQDRFDRMISDFWAEDFLDVEMSSLVARLRSKFKTAILSNIWTGGRDFLLQKYGIVEGKFVDKVYLSCELGVAKPDPKIYELVAACEEVSFNEILFIDDFLQNINEAKEIGINTHHFTIPEEVYNLFLRLLA